ncbi:uncharacterized protein TEOVI_000414700 [Trypanosoma equiperdum]|uniref:Uncharacterized protein n=3 Tax=Trypanozoon TaxID=39700 RepID=Q585A6_TRYB2|nr:hypothetical protein, conserved [Trypanosoma brucei gambiense DAL972]XP_845263.1 hypothetical protein, conserved [Trypanosoma brucei brucei TREU927]AAX80401.1 hypothetical protein, conserved [Trypanosoma brucei]SCU72570.1 hypothetical protein, conserved [Trypanosoma equiperdum]AAZ11704.1 hypothetical protein, conserved [Trypanosoma brucei brucei TREU927]CBH11627.1 hypothetical protein, conserved [Trypanosoma brucei gambiense DAL972]|eukprot:XP_011773912.1 hypothetical protein, conserved [Trypanosoma brucei gambiense DAL972]
MRCVRSAAVLVKFGRSFDSTTRFGKELGFSHKMRDIPVLTGNPRPVAREEEWSCRYKLTDRMEDVVMDILKKEGWCEAEVQREMSEIFERKTQGCRSSLNTWTTVEEFQRTPWYRRYKPTDTCVAKYISYEVVKLLEEALIPPSLRGDPYAHLRKRHMEDNWMNDRFSEEAAKYIQREDLNKHTKGLPQYGQITRRKFLEFDRQFKESYGGKQHVNEAYSAWLQSIGKG